MPVLLLCLTACEIKEMNGWSKDSYGWYEITDATGIYEGLKGEREDCGSILILEDETADEGNGSIAFYDKNHYMEPFFTFDAQFGRKSAKLQGGTLEGKELTVWEMELLPDRAIDVPYGMWMEGTFGNEDGTVTVQGFLSDWYWDYAWTQHKEDTGKLELGWEELQPKHMQTYRQDTSIHLDPAAYFSSLEQPLADGVFQVDWGDEYPAEQQNEFFRVENTDEFSQIVLHTDITVYQFSFFALTANGEEVLFTKTKFRDGDGTLIQLVFHGEQPEYGIRFQDYHGRSYSYMIDADNQNGSVYLEAVKE